MWGTADAVKGVMAEKIVQRIAPSPDGANNGVNGADSVSQPLYRLR